MIAFDVEWWQAKGMIRSFEIADEARTEQLGRRLGDLVRAGDLVFLEGDLGAGKTKLVGGIARGMGFDETEPVTSPTFAIVHEMEGRLPIVHVDLYRLERPSEVADLGLHEHVERGAVVLVEWGERFREALGTPALIVRIDLGEGTQRKISVEALSTRGQHILDAL